MKNAFAFVCLSAAVLALGACGEKKEPARQDTAGGEILDHSIGDDMLPYDTVRSQPPLAPKATASGATGQPETETAGEETENGAPASATESASSPPAAEATPTSE